MGRLERRVRKLEETVERGGFAAALSRVTDADIVTLANYAQRVHDAEETGKPLPILTPEEVEAVQRFEGLRAAAIREGWAEGRYRVA